MRAQARTSTTIDNGELLEGGWISVSMESSSVCVIWVCVSVCERRKLWVRRAQALGVRVCMSMYVYVFVCFMYVRVCGKGASSGCEGRKLSEYTCVYVYVCVCVRACVKGASSGCEGRKLLFCVRMSMYMYVCICFMLCTSVCEGRKLWVRRAQALAMCTY